VRYKYYKNIVVLVWPGAALAPIAARVAEPCAGNAVALLVFGPVMP